MEEIYKRRHQYSEGWTEDELFYYAKRCHLFAYLSIIACIVLIILPLTLVISYSKIVAITLVTLSILGILLCILVILWTKSFSKEQEDDPQLGPQEILQFNKNLSVYVLIASFCLILVNAILVFLIIFWKRIGEDYYIAENGSQHTIDYLHAYRILMIIAILLLFVNTFCWAFFAFSSYITVSEPEFLRTLIYIFDLLFIFCAFVSIFYISKTSTFLGIITSPNIKLQSVLHPSYIICWIFIFFLGFGTFAINLFKRHKYYFFAGGLILICMFCLAGLQFIFFRDSKLVRASYIKDCPQQLRNSHYDWILEQTSCKKYIASSIPNIKYSQDCPAEQISLVWDTTKEEADKIACLNIDCCNAVADAYAKPFFAASFWLLALLFTGFGLTVTLFQISTKFQDFYHTNRTKDYIFMVLLVIVFIAGMVIVFVPVVMLPSQSTQVLVKENVVYVEENKKPIVYPKNWQGVTGCQPLSVIYGQEFTFTGCTDSCSPDSDGVRVSILAKSASILVTKYINSPDIMYIQPQLAQQLLFSNSNASDGFLSVQGKYGMVADFLNKNVQLCEEKDSNEPLDKSVLTIDIYYLHLPQAITEESKSQHHRNLVQKTIKQKKVKAAQDLLNEEYRHSSHMKDEKVHDQQSGGSQSSGLSFTKDQNDYLDSLQFIDLTIVVKDIITQQSIGVTEISFYKKDSDCGKLNQLPIRIIKTNSNGQLTLFNMIPNEYNIGLQREGFYFYCNKFTLEKPNVQPSNSKKNAEYELEISLVKKNKKTGQFTVVLESALKPNQKTKASNKNETTFYAYLGGSYNISNPTKANCLSGFYNNECGGMKFYNSQSTQAISVDVLASVVYTFFVQFIPTNSLLLEINEIKSQGTDLTTNQINAIQNDDIFDKLSPIITFYAHEQDGPIVSYQIPEQLKTSVSHEPNLIWVSLCVDGRIGDITQASPEQFWTYAHPNLQPSWFQRESKDTSVFPSSQFCQNFYDQIKKQQ